MAFKLYNSLSRRVETFEPADGETVRMYSCGPTVYNYVHIGNLRTFTFQDILRRHLRTCGWNLLHVMNITDVEDKIIQGAARAGVPIADYTREYVEAFFKDCRLLRLERPEKIPAATDHIAEMIRLIQGIEAAGLTYANDGSTYFRIANWKEYGKLSRLDVTGIQPGARVDQDEYGKDDARDFVLWKAAREGEPCWQSPYGPGRPGWHLECSAMAIAYLGETLDIHTGGVDLQFPHHENEIAQSESATGKPFVRFWVHAEHLLVDGQKMAKSAGNFFTLRDLIEKGHPPEAVRYLLVSTPHRRQLNFTLEGLRGAATAIERLRNFERRVKDGGFSRTGQRRGDRGLAEGARPVHRGFRRRPEYGRRPRGRVRIHPGLEFGDRCGRIRSEQRSRGARLAGSLRLGLRRAAAGRNPPRSRGENPRPQNRGLAPGARRCPQGAGFRACRTAFGRASRSRA